MSMLAEAATRGFPAALPKPRLLRQRPPPPLRSKRLLADGIEWVNAFDSICRGLTTGATKRRHDEAAVMTRACSDDFKRACRLRARRIVDAAATYFVRARLARVAMMEAPRGLFTFAAHSTDSAPSHGARMGDAFLDGPRATSFPRAFQCLDIAMPCHRHKDSSSSASVIARRGSQGTRVFDDDLPLSLLGSRAEARAPPI